MRRKEGFVTKMINGKRHSAVQKYADESLFAYPGVEAVMRHFANFWEDEEMGSSA